MRGQDSVTLGDQWNLESRLGEGGHMKCIYGSCGCYAAAGVRCWLHPPRPLRHCASSLGPAAALDQRLPLLCMYRGEPESCAAIVRSERALSGKAPRFPHSRSSTGARGFTQPRNLCWCSGTGTGMWAMCAHCGLCTELYPWSVWEQRVAVPCCCNHAHSSCLHDP